MATTSLIVEMVVIGALALFWAVPLSTLVPPGVRTQVEQSFAPLFSQSGIALVFVVAFLYQLGWLVDSVARTLFNLSWGDAWRDAHLKTQFDLDPEVTHRRARSVVYLKSPPHYVQELTALRGIVRLARSATLNFLFIGLVLPIAYSWWSAPLVVLPAAVGSFFLWRNRLLKYWSVIGDGYGVLQEKRAEVA